jgi:cytochrome c553
LRAVLRVPAQAAGQFQAAGRKEGGARQRGDGRHGGESLAADLKDVAAYYASQKLKPARQGQGSRALGQKIYRGGNAATGVAACAGCHGPRARACRRSIRASPAIPEYVEAQLKAFRPGARANDPNGMMRGVVARMSDREIQAVASTSPA